MTLYEECLEALGQSKKILSETDTDTIFKSFQSKFDISVNGRIEWEKISKKVEIESVEDINKYFLDITMKVFILWDNANLPSIETSILKALPVIDDITAVSFDTWLYCPDLSLVVEFYHEGDIRIGYSDK